MKKSGPNPLAIWSILILIMLVVGGAMWYVFHPRDPKMYGEVFRRKLVVILDDTRSLPPGFSQSAMEVIHTQVLEALAPGDDFHLYTLGVHDIAGWRPEENHIIPFKGASPVKLFSGIDSLRGKPVPEGWSPALRESWAELDRVKAAWSDRLKKSLKKPLDHMGSPYETAVKHVGRIMAQSKSTFPNTEHVLIIIGDFRGAGPRVAAASMKIGDGTEPGELPGNAFKGMTVILLHALDAKTPGEIEAGVQYWREYFLEGGAKEGPAGLQVRTIDEFPVQTITTGVPQAG